MKITITGTGYVGLTTGAGMAEYGHDVTCVDIDQTKINILSDGGCTIFEPDLPELLRKNKDKMRFTTNRHESYASADIVIIAVGTPERADGSADLKYIYGVVDDLTAVRKDGLVVVVKSTVPIGTNDRVEAYARQKGAAYEFVSNPEFLSQGTAVSDTLHPSRIVVGANSERARAAMTEVYGKFDCEKIYTDRRSAEMIKYAANDYLALKISYINEIANLCEKMEANIEDVAHGIGCDPRIGRQFLRPGVGYGGSCFPKDTKALHWLANFNDYEIKTIKACIEVNENQKLRLIKKARKYHSDFSGVTAAVLGLTFKPGTDDLREAPSLVNIQVLLEEGAMVKAWDPCAIDAVRKLYPGASYYETIEETVKDADICFIFTEWDEVKSLDPKVFSVMKTPIILDGRNCFSPDVFDALPYTYESIGRRTAGKSRNLLQENK